MLNNCWSPLDMKNAKQANFFFLFFFQNSSVIGQKGQSQNGYHKNTKHTKFSKNEHFLLLDKHTWVCVSGGKKCLFFGKSGGFCFLVTPVLRFALLPYCRRSVQKTEWPILISLLPEAPEIITMKTKELHVLLVCNYVVSNSK